MKYLLLCLLIMGCMSRVKPAVWNKCVSLCEPNGDLAYIDASWDIGEDRMHCVCKNNMSILLRQ